MFLEAIDTSELLGEPITAAYIFQHVKDAIETVGANYVVQVITDNATNCRRMGQLVKSQFPWIVWTPCSAHSLDLLIKDIAKLSWMKDVVNKAKAIVKFVTKKPKVLAIYRSFKDLEIVTFSKTRFAYVF